MTPEKQRIAIARVCKTLACPGCAWERLECSAHDHHVPNYPEDLNAIHEAEKTLLISDTAWADYGNNLQEVCRWYAVGIVPDYRRDLASLAKIAHATALHRCEALLRTIGKWEE